MTNNRYQTGFFGKLFIAAIGSASIRAGQNHRQEGEDVLHSFTAGTRSFGRWYVWGATFIWLVVLQLIMLVVVNGTSEYNYGHPSMQFQVTSYFMCACTEALIVWSFLYAIGATWCRNVDFSLFKRGEFYRLFQRFDQQATRIPAFWLYATAAVPVLAMPIEYLLATGFCQAIGMS